MTEIYLCRVRMLIRTLLTFLFVFSSGSGAQDFRPMSTPNDTLVSPKVLSNNRVQFRIYAPNAQAVLLTGSDIPNIGQGAEMTKQDNGVWKVTLGPLEPGAYRYLFKVDGLSVVDPRSSSVSESNDNVWSLVYVPGADFMDTKDVPHGAIAEVTYYSTALQRFRRMHVYTPPGYETSKIKYPTFYLLHGAFDCDDSWTSVGRAGFILDNLIAEKKAKRMVVVMPAGHTGQFRRGQPIGESRTDEFIQDFLNDIMPYVENHYRVSTEKKYRALAGLSMGGAQTINMAENFAYVGVFSSGIFGITGSSSGETSAPAWEEQHGAMLENPKLKEELKLLWFATGKDDFLIETSRATVNLLRKHGFDVAYNETTGGHTWINWRNYLQEFAPLLFR